MSNYHLLEASHKRDSVRVAFHVSVPDENNSVGRNLRGAVKEHLAQTSVIPWLETNDPTEHTAIGNGEIYEHITTVEFNANLTIIQKRTIIDNQFGTLSAVIPDRIREIYRFWGLDRDVP